MSPLPLPRMAGDEIVLAAKKRLSSERLTRHFAELDAAPDEGAAALPPEEACVVFAAWLEARRARLDAPAIDAALELLGSLPTRELRHWLALRLLVHCPSSLFAKVKPMFDARGAGVLPLAKALREVVLAHPFDTREACLAWLGAVEALDIPGDLLPFLAEKDAALRSAATTLLLAAPASAIAPAAEAIASAAAKEKSATLRRSLTKLAKTAEAARGTDEAPKKKPTARAGKAAQKAASPEASATTHEGNGSSDPAELARAIAVEWDAGGGRAKARELLDALTRAPAGRVWIASLARSAAAKALRNECRAHLERLAQAAPLLDDTIDRELVAEVKRDPRGPLARERGAHLEEAMLRARPVRLDVVRALLGDAALLVRSDAGKVPVAALVTAREAWGARGAAIALDGEAKVTLVHPAQLTPESLGAFVALLAEKKLAQPFEQIARATYRVAPQQRGLETFEIPVATPRRAGPMWAQGWDPIFDDDDWDATAWESEKAFPAWGILATWTHEITMRGGIEPHYESPHQIEAERVSFARAGKPLSLGEVPLVAFSEVVRELLPGEKPAKIAAVASPMAAKPAPAAKPKPASEPSLDDVDDLDDEDEDDDPLPLFGGKDAGKISSVDRLSDVIERVMRSPEYRADASRAIERMGEQAVRAITLVGSAKARDDSALAAGLGLKVDDARALAARLEATLRSVVSD